jgi:hypothetical protein
MSADTARLSTMHSPLGTKPAFGTPGLKLPAYIQNIAKALMRDEGFDKAHAIATAVSQCRKWKDDPKVSPAVRAAAAKAIAEWDLLRARAKATPNKGDRSGASSVKLAARLIRELDILLAVQHVATPQGVAHYHEPIGTPIVAHHSKHTAEELANADPATLKKHYGDTIKALGHKDEYTKLVAKHVALQHIQKKKEAAAAVQKPTAPQELAGEALAAKLQSMSHDELKKHYGTMIKQHGHQHPSTKMAAKYVAIANHKAKQPPGAYSTQPSGKPAIPGIETVKDPAGKPIGYFKKLPSGLKTDVYDLQGKKVGAASTFLNAQGVLGVTAPKAPKGLHSTPAPVPKKVIQPKDDPRQHIQRGELISEEISAAGAYSDGHYKSINAAAKAGTANKEVAALKAAVAKSIVQKDITTWRYIPFETSKTIFGEVGSKVGQEFVDKRFASTSAFHGITKGFGSVEVSYKLKAGAQALDMNKGHLSHHPSEHEVLVQAGTKYKVVSDTNNGGTRRIVLETA